MGRNLSIIIDDDGPMESSIHVRAWEIKGGHNCAVSVFVPSDFVTIGVPAASASCVQVVELYPKEVLGRFVFTLESRITSLRYQNFVLSFQEYLIDAAIKAGERDAGKAWAEKTRKEFEGKRKSIREQISERDGEFCKICGKADDLAIDHDIPVSQGGTNDIENLMFLCQPCNSRKGNRPFLQVVETKNPA